MEGGHWISDSIFMTATGQYLDKYGRVVRPPPPTQARPPPPGQAQSFGPQQHYHVHEDMHRTHSAGQAPMFVLPDRGRSHGRSHSRSRSRSGSFRDKEEYYRMKFEREQHERQHLIDQAAAEANHHREEEEKERKKIVDEAKRKEKERKEKEEEDRKRMIREAEDEKQQKKRDRERMIKEAEEDAKEEKRKKKEERERMIKDAEDERQQKKRDRERMIKEAEDEAKEEKRKEEEEFKKWELKKKEKELLAKEKKDKEDQEYLARVQHDMAKFGMSPKYVENMIKHKEEDKKHKIGSTSSRRHSRGRDLVVAEKAAPTYPKIHRDDIETETLRHYDIQYERAQDDRDYIILLEELTVEDTDILFKHTKKIRKERKKRSSSLLPAIESSNNPEYAFVRRRSRTRDAGERSRSRVRGKSPMAERMAEKIVRMA